jgi:transcriptional regulator with XRE-family HTH domain
VITEWRAHARDSDGTEDGSATAIVQGEGVARRVANRRIELGMSIEELAERAAIAPEYLRYFEGSSVATLRDGTLLLLALALDTTPRDLTGGEADDPTGRRRDGHHPALDSLNRDQCEAHLLAGGVGRIIFSTERGPMAFPVQFEFTNGEVIFSTEESKAVIIVGQKVVGFEIDQVDDATSARWSVSVTGRARRVQGTRKLLQLSTLDLVMWAGASRHALIAIEPKEITGHVIIQRTTQHAY